MLSWFAVPNDINNRCVETSGLSASAIMERGTSRRSVQGQSIRLGGEKEQRLGKGQIKVRGRLPASSPSESTFVFQGKVCPYPITAGLVDAILALLLGGPRDLGAVIGAIPTDRIEDI